MHLWNSGKWNQLNLNKEATWPSGQLVELARGSPGFESRSGARFSKVPVTLRARNQIFKSKYKE